MARDDDLFSGKSVLITGGTGSLGRAMTKHLLENYSPKKVIILSRDEFKQSEMAKVWPDDGVSPVRYIIGDVRNPSRLNMAFRGVDFVIHAAALKQADTGERDSDEFVETNVQGARNVIRAAIDQGVKRVVALSTDKACNPVNLYGATKLCMEKLFMAAKAYSTETIFTACRYGNVTGSRGSVVPLFLDKIKRGEPLTITDMKMSRFVITMPQAIAVIEKAFRAPPGTIVVPKLPSVTIGAVALALMPPKYMEWSIVGLRPGEKLAESLIAPDEPREYFGTHYLLGRGLPGHQYSSDTNPDFLSSSQFLDLMKDVKAS